MNNKILEEFQAYNNGGIYNEPISQYIPMSIPMNTNNTSGIYNPPLSSYLPLFTSTNTSTGFGPIMAWPQPNTVELQANETINTDVIHQDPGKTEEYVRRELAQKLAEKLIEEDLIQIYADRDVESGDTQFRAKIKVVQE